MAYFYPDQLWRSMPVFFTLGILGSCQAGEQISLPPIKTPTATDAGRAFTCADERTVDCVNQVYYSCRRVGAFLQEQQLDCGKQDLVCSKKLKCVTCLPGTSSCNGDQVMRCRDDSGGYEPVETCDLAAGFQCDRGACTRMCDVARRERSYMGCEFYAADLDNAAIDATHDASSQQYAIVVSNLQRVSVQVTVTINRGAPGAPLETAEVAKATVPPGDLEVFKLPRREVDGSSDTGLNDGTHTALSSAAYRVTSTHPIIAYQFNPLDNVNVFSNDASLLLPSSALGSSYTVVGWPQTISDSSDPRFDFDPSETDEDLRAFLTVIGTAEGTALKVTMGPKVVRVVGTGSINEMVAGDTVELELGPFDVLNLETGGFMADFTGTLVEATRPVAVFVGSEASDVPGFEQYETRQCCADHLEEQLFPDNTLGNRFLIARMPPRAHAVNTALANPADSVAESNEPEWVRIVAVRPGTTAIQTTLAAPDQSFVLHQYEDATLEADRDFEISADQPIAVLQALASQEVVGIPKTLPGGDPSIIAVPPVEQYRDNYVFLTPDQYAFDYVIITAPKGSEVLLDGKSVTEQCSTTAIAGAEHNGVVSETEWQVHRCSFSDPVISPLPNPQISFRDRREGVHTIEASERVGIVVYGFDRFVSYAYTGGLNLDVLF
jgi:hypothetical protein